MCLNHCALPPKREGRERLSPPVPMPALNKTTLVGGSQPQALPLHIASSPTQAASTLHDPSTPSPGTSPAPGKALALPVAGSPDKTLRSRLDTSHHSLCRMGQGQGVFAVQGDRTPAVCWLCAPWTGHGPAVREAGPHSGSVIPGKSPSLSLSPLLVRELCWVYFIKHLTRADSMPSPVVQTPK